MFADLQAFPLCGGEIERPRFQCMDLFECTGIAAVDLIGQDLSWLCAARSSELLHGLQLPCQSGLPGHHQQKLVGITCFLQGGMKAWVSGAGSSRMKPTVSVISNSLGAAPTLGDRVDAWWDQGCEQNVLGLNSSA